MPVINGTAGRDSLIGTAQADVISGGEGRDTVDGGGGDDVIYGFGASDVTPGGGAIDATLLASGLSRPVFATSPPGDPDRLFILEQHAGRIQILDLTTNELQSTPFLDIANNELNTGGEEGLLGLAFHPDYATNGLYYVYVTNADGNNEVWQYTRGPDPDVSSTTRELVMTINHPTFGNHNGGWMAFGPDGYLYIATGDGGGSGDPNNNAQNINSLLGKILRIDVDGDDFPADAGRNYAIPNDNPFVGVAGADEVYAIGLRNPWRMSFDSETGDLLIADVGQNAREEINFVPAGTLAGRNFGWVVREGTQVFDTSRPGNPPANSPLFTHPIHDYGHGSGPEQGFSVTGGYVIRGPDAGGQGLYVFADFVTGNLWTLRATASGAQDVMRRNDQIVVNGGDFDQIASFAQDGQGRLYVIGLDGDIHRLTFNAGAGDVGDVLRGGDGDDEIYGGLGADILFGGEDNDMLVGGAGNDVLKGNSGADAMSGGTGNDTYYVGAVGDTVTELGGEGADRVYARISYSLVANVETLVLLDAANINGVGNGLRNALVGNAGNNRLEGRAGNDTLNGGAGADILIGGQGADNFVFKTPLGPANVDAITDFSVADDTIRLGDQIFGLGAGTLAASAFHIGASAADANDRIIYNSATGALYFDPDGAGGVAQVQFAQLSAGLALTNADFFGVA